MAKEISLKEGRNISILLIAVLISTCSALLWASWHTYSAFEYSKSTIKRQILAEKLRGRIVHLDEVLTMSARMAATTGKLRWEQRYHQFEPALDKAIEEAIILAPEAYKGNTAAMTDIANKALVAMEYRAFSLVRKGHKEEAREILFGDDYEMQKKIYAKGIKEFIKSISITADDELTEQNQRLSLYAIPIFILFPLLLFSWIIIYLSINKWFRQSEVRYKNIFENSLTEIYVFDIDTYRFIKVNQGACRNIGYSIGEMNKLTVLDIKPELTLEQFNELVEPLRTGKKDIIHFITVHLRKNGSFYPVEVHLQLTEFLSKSAFVAIILDITERHEAEEKLKLSAKVFSDTTEGITITDSTGTIIDVNPAFCEITNYSREDVIGQNTRILSSGKHGSEFYSKMWQKINVQGHWQGEIWNRKKEGTLYAALLSISSILDEDGKTLHYVGIFSDITHSKKQQETLELMAHYDVLTQLPNRVLLADRFIQALSHSKRQETILAVCFLDLDNFKPVNDIYGHETGDQLLVEVAKRIKESIRDEDTVSRQGGDEFILLLSDIESFPHCEQMLKRIIEALARPYVIDEQKILNSASIGVSLYPMDDADLDTLIRHADQAMYQAKLAGRNRYSFFNTEQNHLDVQKSIKLKEIENALVNNELCLYYQPKVDMTTGKVFGAEALIRWNHPEKGMITPLKFLLIIEETDLEIQIGNWVMNEALKQLNSWREQNIELEVSINISSYHLQSPSFIDELEKTLALYPKVDSKHLQLEILESSALGDLNLVSGILKTCINAIGVKIALDDFGTGYSSLTHLRNLPTETIKIDQAFVRDILDDPNDYAIVDSVIGLASSFNRELIAEGVETTEHGLILLVMGCNKAQGYGIARPMPVLEIPEWLTNYTPNQQWIDCANKHRTQKENRMKLFRLTLAQWQKHFEKNIQSSPGNNEQWSILKRTNCHCGVWLQRARQERFFEEKSLQNLERAHNTMHAIGGDLFNKYQEGNIDNAREVLKDLQISVENMSNAFGRCE